MSGSSLDLAVGAHYRVSRSDESERSSGMTWTGRGKEVDQPPRALEEYVDAYNEDQNFIGALPRQEVHARGYWHHTFHCWIIQREAGHEYVLCQKRHRRKDMHPQRLDVTAAGHLLAGETVADGVRELNEELGLVVPFKALVPLGVFEGILEESGLVDKELSHEFLYETDRPLSDYRVQTDEVEGLFRMRIEDALALFCGTAATVGLDGFQVDGAGVKRPIHLRVSQDAFVPRDPGYYLNVFQAIQRYWAERYA